MGNSFTFWRIKKILQVIFSKKFKDIYLIVLNIQDYFTEEELSALEINIDGEIVSFKEQMLMSYFCKYPLPLKMKLIKEKISEIVEDNRFLFKLKGTIPLNEFFLKEFEKRLFLTNGIYGFTFKSRWNLCFRSRNIYFSENVDALEKLCNALIEHIDPKYKQMLRESFEKYYCCGWDDKVTLTEELYLFGAKIDENDVLDVVSTLEKQHKTKLEASLKRGNLSFEETYIILKDSIRLFEDKDIKICWWFRNPNFVFRIQALKYLVVLILIILLVVCMFVVFEPL